MEPDETPDAAHSLHVEWTITQARLNRERANARDAADGDVEALLVDKYHQCLHDAEYHAYQAQRAQHHAEESAALSRAALGRRDEFAAALDAVRLAEVGG